MFQRILSSATMRILFGFAAVLAPVFALTFLLTAVVPKGTQLGAGFQIGHTLASSALVFLAYMALYRWLERRTLAELALRPMLPQLAIGLLMGASLISLTVGVVAVVGRFNISDINPLAAMLPAFAMALQSSILEEVLFRGILLRILNARFGSLPALVISGLIFGAMHKMNPDATWVSALAVAIEAGLLLGLAYLASGTLWLPIGIHFAWNFMQSGVYSLSVSGISQPDGLFSTQISGPIWATGGGFGVEQSLQAVVFCLIASAALYRVAKTKGRLQKAHWRKLPA